MRCSYRVDRDGLAAIRSGAAYVRKKAQRENYVAFVADLGDVSVCIATGAGVGVIGTVNAGVIAKPIVRRSRARDIGVAGSVDGNRDAVVVPAAPQVSGVHRRSVRLVEIRIQLHEDCIRVRRRRAAACKAGLVETALKGIDERESRFTIWSGTTQHVGCAGEIDRKST